jgi:hypothetical protein
MTTKIQITLKKPVEIKKIVIKMKEVVDDDSSDDEEWEAQYCMIMDKEPNPWAKEYRSYTKCCDQVNTLMEKGKCSQEKGTKVLIATMKKYIQFLQNDKDFTNAERVESIEMIDNMGSNLKHLEDWYCHCQQFQL